MATGSFGNIHCCLCEAVVDAKERRSVATTINLLKDTVVDVAISATLSCAAAATESLSLVQQS